MAARLSVLTAVASASTIACCAGRAEAHEPPFGTGVFARGEQFLVRTPRGLVVSSSPERRDFRLLCSEALGVSEYETAGVFVRADGDVLVGASDGLVRVSADLCSLTRVLAFENVRVAALAPDPHDSQGVYVATSAGLYESRDEGETFSKLDAQAFDSLEVSQAVPDLLFAAGSEARPPGAGRAYFARWQRGQPLELRDFALGAHEFGVSLLGSDAERVFAVAHAYLGTEFPDRFLVSADDARSWSNPLSTAAIAATLPEPESGAQLIGSETGLWRVAAADAMPVQLRTEAVSCLALASQHLYVCDGAGAQGGVAEASDGGAHWASILRWNQVSGLPACPAKALSVQLCEASWKDWQLELPAGPPLAGLDAGPSPAVDAAWDAAEPALPDAGAAPTDAAAAPAPTADNDVRAAAASGTCAAVSVTAARGVPFLWLWLVVTLSLLHRTLRLLAKRSS